MSVVIRCKIEANALTVPQSYKLRFIPNNHLGTDEVAAGMTAINPALTPDLAKSAISALMQTLQQGLINGDHITLDDSFSFSLSFTGRLDAPDDPLPPIADCLHVQVHPTANFVKKIHQQGRLERVDMTEKLPLITQAENATLRLNDVLASTDILQLTGENLDFDPQLGTGECVISGTRSGRAVQTQFGTITSSGISLIPTIPAQEEPWNNEYNLSLSVRYTEHGTLRTGTYRRKLRTPLTLSSFGQPNPPEVGILTDKAAAPHVKVTGGAVSADTRLRIQVVQDLPGNRLLFSLLDMREDGAAGTTVSVTQNGAYVLNGFSNSPVSSLNITINDYAGLWSMIRSGYSGRLVEVLDVKTA
uniref:hypothetical protein n=1 Tax=Candidatus Electronema sp. TaxID=2698783 RepID=UPI0040563070